MDELAPDFIEQGWTADDIFEDWEDVITDALDYMDEQGYM